MTPERKNAWKRILEIAVTAIVSLATVLQLLLACKLTNQQMKQKNLFLCMFNPKKNTKYGTFYGI